jgi:hypothetical protein
VRKRKAGRSKNTIEMFDRDADRRTSYVTAWKEARYCTCGKHIKAGGWGAHRKACAFARALDA